MSAPRAVLVIAASDSSGGAGLTRDVQTLSEFHTAVRCAVTAVTVQTDAELRATHHMPPELVRAQIRAALDGGAVGAIKIGMLGTAATVQAVADSLPPREQIPIVLDPVLLATSGGVLLDQAGQALLRQVLLPRVTLLTPNIPEVTVLLEGRPGIDEMIGEATEEAMWWAPLQRLLALGPSAVLLKGGHGDGDGDSVVDRLALLNRGVMRITAPRIRAQRRGTGCSLASAIAAQLAAGQTLLEACTRAQAYIGEALRRGC